MRIGQRIGACVCALAVASACSGPRLAIDSSPPGSRIFVDGKYAGTDQMRGPLPYYGSLAISAVPPLRNADGHSYQEQRKIVTFGTPASRWLFPLDFFIEIGIWALTPDEPYRARVDALQLEAGIEVGESPSLSGLRARGLAAGSKR